VHTFLDARFKEADRFIRRLNEISKVEKQG
jgi:hypothetical protein